MDNSVDSWAPQPSLVAIGGLGALVAVAGAILSGDRAGAVLFAVAAVVLALLSGYGALIRPRLAADATGLRVRTLRGTVSLRWPETLTLLRATKRLGRETWALEVSSDEDLFIFGRIDLGSDPVEVLDELNRLRNAQEQ